MNLFARARGYASLTPRERAILRLLEGLGAVALVGAVTACAQYLASRPVTGFAAIDWAGIARACVTGAAVAVLMALAKYFKAHGDPALADALGQLGSHVASATAGGATATAAVTPPLDASGPASAEIGTDGAMSR